MTLAYTMAPGRGDIDLLLAGLAADLAARGLRCCGTVQINTARTDAQTCDMDVRVLPDGPVLRISQDRGPLARLSARPGRAGSRGGAGRGTAHRGRGPAHHQQVRQA